MSLHWLLLFIYLFYSFFFVIWYTVFFYKQLFFSRCWASDFQKPKQLASNFWASKWQPKATSPFFPILVALSASNFKMRSNYIATLSLNFGDFASNSSLDWKIELLIKKNCVIVFILLFFLSIATFSSLLS